MIDFSNAFNRCTLKSVENLVRTWKLNNQLELELKLCHIKKADNNGSLKFYNGTTQKNALFLKNAILALKNAPENSFSCANTVDTFYRSKRKPVRGQSSKVRTSENTENNEIEIIEKTLIDSVDFNYWMDGLHFAVIRLSLSLEKPLKNIPADCVRQKAQRVKERISLAQDQVLLFELTKIKNDDKFEFEIELVRSEKCLAMRSELLAEAIISKVPFSFEFTPRVRATFTVARNTFFYNEKAVLIVRKNPKTDSYNVYCHLARNSQKTILVANKGIEVPVDLEKQLSRQTTGEFKYNIIRGTWLMVSVKKEGRVTLIKELIEMMGNRIGI